MWVINVSGPMCDWHKTMNEDLDQLCGMVVVISPPSLSTKCTFYVQNQFLYFECCLCGGRFVSHANNRQAQE